jgi:SulP family sulfate permease
MLKKGGYLNEIGRDHLFRGKRAAFGGVIDRLDRSICATCTARIFEECRTLPGPHGPPTG